MLPLRMRRFFAAVALTVASLFLPLSDLSASPRSESHWSAPERVLRQGFSFWHTLTSLFDRAGMRIDGNG